MNRFVIPSGNWTTALADAIDRAVDGDEIVCRDEPMRELARGAHARMWPEKVLRFMISGDDEISAESSSDG